MSWFSVPLPNPFKSLPLSDDDNDEEDEHPNNAVPSAIGETIGRQFRAFISPETSNSGVNGSSSSTTLEGIRSDLEEIKGTFKSSLSVFSSNRAVSEISKLAANFLQLNDEDHVDPVSNNNRINNDDDDDDDNDGDNDEEEDGVVGINDEVVQFAEQISNRSELWTEFPLSLDHEFEMSETQYEHASVIEQLVPSLADLRSNISSIKSENWFWMIYFILLLPRLNGEDLELLSTPEIVEARATLLKMLQAKKSEINSENPHSDEEVHNKTMKNRMTSEISNASTNVIEGNESNTTKKLLDTEEESSFTFDDPNQPNAKPGYSNPGFVAEEHEKASNWKYVQEKKPVNVTSTNPNVTPKQCRSEDDISFSDLDDDDLFDRQSKSGSSQAKWASSPEGSNDWVRLNKNVDARGSKVNSQSSLRERDSEGEDSSGWLTVDDYDP